MISIIVFSVGILVGGAGMVLLSLGASELLQRFLATDWEAEPEDEIRLVREGEQVRKKNNNK